MSNHSDRFLPYKFEQFDIPHEECGIVGVITQAIQINTAQAVALGLSTLQHRGQEAAGIAISDGNKIFLHKNVGQISQVFTPDILNKMDGNLGIGHTRYSTTGSSILNNAQPFLVGSENDGIAVAHNGNLLNTTILREKLLAQGTHFESSTDSEVMAKMITKAKGATWEERIINCMALWLGAFSLLVLTNQGIFALRDPWGMRPLSVGRLLAGGYAVASETCALEAISCVDITEVKPGELITLTQSSLTRRQGLPQSQPLAICTFEQIYFSRPDSVFDGQLVYMVRQRLGRQLAIESPVDADMVIPIPDSSIPSAIGFAKELNINYEQGIVRNSYVGRTFIMPSTNQRTNGVSLKLMPLPEFMKGKRVVIVDDSIIRGITIINLIARLRRVGVREIHLRVSCPPIRHPCHMGIDIGEYEELIAHNFSVIELARKFDVDSLHFLSLENMMKAIDSNNGYCNACFTGKYPFEVKNTVVKNRFENSND